MALIKLYDWEYVSESIPFHIIVYSLDDLYTSGVSNILPVRSEGYQMRLIINFTSSSNDDLAKAIESFVVMDNDYNIFNYISMDTLTQQTIQDITDDGSYNKGITYDFTQPSFFEDESDRGTTLSFQVVRFLTGSQGGWSTPVEAVCNTLPTFENINNIEFYAVDSLNGVDTLSPELVVNSFKIININKVKDDNKQVLSANLTLYALDKDTLEIKEVLGTYNKISNSDAINEIEIEDIHTTLSTIMGKDYNEVKEKYENDTNTIFQFVLNAYDNMEYGDEWRSNTFSMMFADALTEPTFNNIEEGMVHTNAVLNSDGEIEDLLLYPEINCPEEYQMQVDDLEITWGIVTKSGVLPTKWYSTVLKHECIQGEEYKALTDENGNYILDENGNVIPETDENGDIIVISEGTYIWIYMSDAVGLKEAGTYTIIAKTENITNGDIKYSEEITFIIKDLVVNYPSINYSSGSKAGTLTGTDNKFSDAVTLNYADSDLFTYQLLYINGKQQSSPSIIYDDGSYTIKVTGLDKETSYQTSVTAKFTISGEYPSPIEIFGVYNNDTAYDYTIDVIKEDNVSYEIYYVDANDKRTNPVLTTITRNNSDGISSNAYRFTLSTVSVYNLYVIATHDLSGLQLSAEVTNFEVLDIGVSDVDLLNINPIYPFQGASAHSAIAIITPMSVRNSCTYNIAVNDSSYYKYIVPLLLLQNTKVTAVEQLNSTNRTQSKSFNGIINYVPEMPTILGVNENGLYYTERTISFVNTATKPLQAQYYIFIDGHLLTDPFDNNFIVNTYGYHFITILAHDTVTPTKYLYKNIKFLLKMESNSILRKPFIVIRTNDKLGEIPVRVHFPCKLETAVHTIRIQYLDGTEENFTYDYDIGYVDFTFNRNCVITSTTTLINSGLSSSDNITINVIYDEKPDIDNISIIGPIPQKIKDMFGQINTINIGPGFIIDFPKEFCNEYEAYVNGMPYEFGTWITNKDEEIRKYTIEVIVKNENNEKTSYYTNEIIVDTTSAPYPQLLNYEQYKMNHSDIGDKVSKNVIIKNDINLGIDDISVSIIKYNNYKYSEPIETITNNTFQSNDDEDNNIIDDEYILSITATYYNGIKRTSSFYFSINTSFLNEHMEIDDENYTKNSEYAGIYLVNEDDETYIDDSKYFIEDLTGDNKYLRIVVKTLDYNHPNVEDIAKDGELVIDRRTGHIYYKENSIFELQPITKSIEDIVIDVEKHLFNTEALHLEFNYLYQLSMNLLEYYTDKANEFYDKLKNFESRLTVTCNAINQSRADLDTFINNLQSYETDITNSATLSFNEFDSNINDLNSDIDNLMTSFKNLNNILIRDLFSKASSVKEDVQYISDDIKKRVTTSSFNTWKNNEEDKYNRTVNFMKNKYGY